MQMQPKARLRDQVAQAASLSVHYPVVTGYLRLKLPAVQLESRQRKVEGGCPIKPLLDETSLGFGKPAVFLSPILLL